MSKVGDSERATVSDWARSGNYGMTSGNWKVGKFILADKTKYGLWYGDEFKGYFDTFQDAISKTDSQS